MDFYLLTTNELIERLKWHPHITRLSLKACAFLTDKPLGMALAALQNLTYLNLSGCSNVSDLLVPTLSGLCKLEFLSLEKTKISDKGLSEYLTTLQTTFLVELHLSYCTVTSNPFQAAKDLPSVSVLMLNNTKVDSLDPLCLHYPNLSQLSVRNTPVMDLGVECLKTGLGKLQSLDISNTKVTDCGLASLQGKQLHHLVLPDRLLVTDTGISYLKDMPLEHLNLSDFINLTDACLPTISSLQRLQTLSLSNTKVSDEGLSCLAGLNNIEDLDLSKTVVSNGVTELFDLPFLSSLNLSATRVNAEEIFPAINRLRALTKLNITRVTVDNKHMSMLRSSNLNLLVLDSELALESGCRASFANCPALKIIRNGKTVYNRDELYI